MSKTPSPVAYKTVFQLRYQPQLSFADRLRALGLLIKRLESDFRGMFKNPRSDTTRCARATVPLEADLADMSAGFKRFLDSFGDVQTCRSKCSIHEVILMRHRTTLEGYVQQASMLPKNANTLGFRKIAAHLSKILNRGDAACSCWRCGFIGDAVIALETPRDMRLECTDRSFDYLCPPIQQDHKRHPAEIPYMNATGLLTL